MLKKIIDFIYCIFISLLIIGACVMATVAFKPLYYFDINYLNIAQTSGYTEDEIKLNYDYLIDYNLNAEEMEFHMPTLPYSTEGKIHFEEVRAIVQNVILLFKVCLVVGVLGAILHIKNKNIRILKVTSITLITLPIVLSLPILLAFDRSFVIFHELLFDNDYWLFDARVDPVITILPEEFFLHTGLLVLGLILVASIFMSIVYRYFKKSIKNQSMQDKQSEDKHFQSFLRSPKSKDSFVA